MGASGAKPGCQADEVLVGWREVGPSNSMARDKVGYLGDALVTTGEIRDVEEAADISWVLGCHHGHVLLNITGVGHGILSTVRKATERKSIERERHTERAVMFLMTVLGTVPTPTQDGLLNKSLQVACLSVHCCS